MTSTFVLVDRLGTTNFIILGVCVCVCARVRVCVSVSHCVSLYTLPKAQHNLLVMLQVTNPTPAHVLQ
jgi:hypothetical protein